MGNRLFCLAEHCHYAGICSQSQRLLLEHNGAPAIPFGSIHPQYTNFKEEIRRLADAGIKGVKFHPEYQEFDMDDPAVYPIYEELGKNGMIMLFHAGYDPAYESSRSYPKSC